MSKHQNARRIVLYTTTTTNNNNNNNNNKYLWRHSQKRYHGAYKTYTIKHTIVNNSITRETVHGNKRVFSLDLNWDVVVADFMAIGSEFHAIVAAISNRFSPVMVLLIIEIASRL